MDCPSRTGQSGSPAASIPVGRWVSTHRSWIPANRPPVRRKWDAGRWPRRWDASRRSAKLLRVWSSSTPPAAPMCASGWPSRKGTARGRSSGISGSEPRLARCGSCWAPSPQTSRSKSAERAAPPRRPMSHWRSIRTHDTTRRRSGSCACRPAVNRRSFQLSSGAVRWRRPLRHMRFRPMRPSAGGPRKSPAPSHDRRPGTRMWWTTSRCRSTIHGGATCASATSSSSATAPAWP